MAPELAFGDLHVALELRNISVGDFGGLVEITGSRGLFRTEFCGFNFLLDATHGAERFLFLLPLGAHAGDLFLEIGEFALEVAAALDRRRIGFLAQGLPLDFQLHDTPLDFVDFLRHRIDLDAQTRGRLVDQVDGFIRQKAVADVAIRQRGRSDHGPVGDAHAVVRFVAFLEATENRDRAFHAGLTHEHRLKATFQRRVFLDMQAILIERGRTDHTQFAARQHGLEHVARIHAAFCLAGTYQRVQFVDEDDVQSFGGGDLLHHGLETLFELAAELRASDQCAEIERHQLLVAQPLGHVAADDALGESLGNGGLAYARLADEHRIVLRSAREHLNNATDFFIAADHGIELALAGGLGKIARELLDRLVLPFGRLVGDLVRSAHELERVEQGLAMCTDRGQHTRAVGAFGVGQRQQQVFGGDVLVAERLGFLLGGIDDLREFAAERGLRVALRGVARSFLRSGGPYAGDICTDTLQHRNHDTLVLREQRQQEVQIVDEGIAALTRERDGFVERFSALHGETVGIDHGVVKEQS